MQLEYTLLHRMRERQKQSLTTGIWTARTSALRLFRHRVPLSDASRRMKAAGQSGNFREGLVLPEGETLNSLFDTMAEWEQQLKRIDFDDLEPGS